MPPEAGEVVCMARSLRRTRRRIPLLLSVGLVFLAAPQVANADKPSTVCAPGFNLGALTFEETLDLPRTQAGLSDGFFTEEVLAEAFDSFDKNSDGLICVQENLGSTKANPASAWQYLYNVVDNNASKP